MGYGCGVWGLGTPNPKPQSQLRPIKLHHYKSLNSDWCVTMRHSASLCVTMRHYNLKKMKTTRSPLDTSKKSSERFRPLSYLYSYYQVTSTKFLERITLLYTMVEASIKHRNNIRWAKCCHCVEGRVSKGSLNHPEKEMITFKDLMIQENIKTEDDMLIYMKKILPRNLNDEILLPQINMMHPNDILEDSEADILREKLSKVEEENRLLKVEVEVMKQLVDAASKDFYSLNEKISGLEAKLYLTEIDE